MKPVTALAALAMVAATMLTASSTAYAQENPDAVRKICRDGAYAGIITAGLSPSTLKKDISLKILPGAAEPFQYGYLVRFSVEGEDKFGDRLVFPFRCEAHRTQPRGSFNTIYRRAGDPEFAPGYPKAQADSAKWGSGILQARRHDEERPSVKTAAGQPLKPSEMIAQSRDLRRPDVRQWADKLDGIEARLLEPAKKHCAEVARDQYGMQVEKVVGSKYHMDEDLFLVNVHGSRNGARIAAGCSITRWDKKGDRPLPDGKFALLNFRPNLPHDEDRSFK